MNVEPIWRGDIQQRLFRELMEAFARPGTVRDVTAYLGGSGARQAALATLMDGETTLADPHGQIALSDWPLLQARHAAVETARYVVADGRRAPDFQPALGTLESPEFGATLLIEVDVLGGGPMTLALAGPGIQTRTQLRVGGLHAGWIAQRAHWNAGFPLGVDMLLFDAARMVALPRTTHTIVSAGAE